MTTRHIKVDKGSISFDANNKPVFADNNTEASLKEAAEVLRSSGGVVAFPTETVYGLGGNALDTASVHAIYKAKNRPADNPLILHISSLDQLKRNIPGVEVPEVYKPLIEKFWPGPLTILLPVPRENNPISPACTVGQSTFAVRMPAHPVGRALIALSDVPLAAPSANASTRPSTTTAQHVISDLNGKIPMVLDGGACEVGVESTVVDGLCSPPMLLRPGGVSVEQIRQVGGEPWKDVIIGKATAGAHEKVRTPGMKYKHYSPRANVLLIESKSQNASDAAQKAFDYIKTQKVNKIGVLMTRNLGHDFVESLQNAVGTKVVAKDLGKQGSDISRNLFGFLRDMDSEGVELIIVEGIDESDEGLAVMNRLRKASSSVLSL
ncbi:threonylcarbamoyl-AMP synthase [Trichomonascus vanleenenianus]|uniref:threonylcarbamoyladenylate synthase n=1 Tax=Trichomonascus vanleenenianus TaxID=2268995 RepID=UPI003ECAB790